jgi:hypothetical protein
LKKEILSDDFKKRKIFWKNIAENFTYGKILHLTSLFGTLVYTSEVASVTENHVKTSPVLEAGELVPTDPAE